MSRSLIGGLDIAHSDYSFIDLGAGKGRVLLIASHFRFRRVVGIELSEKLAQIARANVAVYRSAEQRCRNIDVVVGDAGEIDFPAGPMVIYLYNAFDAVVLGQVSTRLAASLARSPRDVLLLYVNPIHRRVLDRLSWMAVEREIDGTVIYRSRQNPGVGRSK
jgi:SAM-dependent methyltransferase